MLPEYLNRRIMRLPRWALAAMLAALLIIGCQALSTNRTDEPGGGWTPRVWTDYVEHGPCGDRLPDFSSAGYAMGRRTVPSPRGPLFDVTQAPFGAVPDDGRDDTAAIQKAVDAAAGAKGGVVFLPRGRYDIHTTSGDPFLQIRASGVVLRGEGSDAAGTILHLGAPGKDGPVRRLGTVPADIEARHWAAVAILGSEDRRELTRYTRDVRRGQRVVGVEDSSGLTPGQTVIVEFTDPAIDLDRPAFDKTDLVAQLTAPFQLSAVQTDTFSAAAKTHAWLVTIDEIIDTYTIRLSRPARFDQWLRYTPRIYAFNGVREAGIEHLRLQCSWPGGYRHHKPFADAQGNVVRSAKEQDYLWNGIWISYATDGWVRDVTFNDLTQGIIVNRSSDLTLENLDFTGQDGHAGITVGHGNDVLIRHVDYHARLVHPVTMTMMAAGNVVTECTIHYDGRDDNNATDAVIDFHGIFPYENLFDNLTGFYVCPGGDLSVMPHAGVRNVFWNITAPRKMSCYTCDTDDGFARTYDFGSTTSKSAATMYEHFPQAFYIGLVRRDGGHLTVGESAADRRGPWMTVEGLNRPGIRPASLFEAQKTKGGKK